MTSLQPVHTILFDLDDTLYRNPEVPELVRENIAKYMREKLEIPADKVEARNRDFYVDYGTTLAGLKVQGYDVDYDKWHACVHGSLPYTRLFQRDPELRRIISSLPQPKYVFTNADIRHAERVLDLLGIRDLFQDIVCFESIMRAAIASGVANDKRPIICKPAKEAFELALEQAGAEAASTLFFDDSHRNVTGAATAGLRAVLVGSKGAGTPAIAEIGSVHDLPKALPELWAKQATAAPDSHRSLQPLSPEVQVVAQ